MHEVLINNYNSSVPEDGICYFLGDMGLSSAGTVQKVISRLHGTKVCILGNHDKGVNSMYTAGFDVVLHGASLVIAGETVTMSHCPLLGLYREDITNMKGGKEGEHWHGESRHAKHSFPNNGQFHLHGHTHKEPAERILLKQFDCGVRANAYRPVNISELESWISRYGK